MKQWLKNELRTLSAIDSSSEVYRIFFRLIQAWVALGLVWSLCFLAPLMLSMDESPRAWFIAMWLVPLLQFSVAEICLRNVPKRFAAVAAGLVLSLVCMGGWGFPIGLLGLYSFLNPQFQKAYLRNAPVPFREMLSAANLNFIEAEKETNANV